jgi:hypothetical protein
MTTSSLRFVLLAAAGLMTFAGPARAQIAPDSWRTGTAVTLFGGVATATSDAGAIGGGAVGWEVTPRFTLEGAVSWLDRADASEGFGAALKVRTSVGHRRTSPFIEGGFGLYRASIDPVGRHVPEFYQRRIADYGAGMNRRVFTDPAFNVGGGWTWFLSRHVALQPAIDATIVTRDAHSVVITAATVRLGYHFEDHPVTLTRR